MELFYHQPAKRWEATLPLGNGRLGAMVWGNVENDVIGTNEDSIWSGYPHDKNNKNSYNYLAQCRSLIEQELYEEAEALICEHMLGEYNESYLPLGNITMDFEHNAPYTNYKRSLDIQRAIASVEYTVDGCQFKREYFISHPAQAFLIQLTSEHKNITVTLGFESQLQIKPNYTPKGIHFEGQCPEHVDPNYVDHTEPIIQGNKGMFFNGSLNLLECDGSVSCENNQLIIKNASLLVLSFEAVKPAIVNEANSYESFLAEHIKDYQHLYNRVDLFLGEQLGIPTDERLQKLREGNEDSGLFALFFQYGRYLLISSSREGSQPANLQGIWSWQLRAPWSSNFTTNINTQMNYWPALSCNLKECLTPYFDFLKRIVEEGKKTAQIHYGCRGFVHHHNADYWASTNPVGLAFGENIGEGVCATWSFWPMGGAWLTNELFKYYEYESDKDFLQNIAYPILREASLFLIDWLFDSNGQYITSPSTSPENRFITPSGNTSCIAQSTAMDLALIREVFGNYTTTCRILNLNNPELAEIEERLSRLAPFQIGSRGQLLEWHKEFEESEPGHRHLSHLYGLFPSELFESDTTLKSACSVSLKERLSHGSGHTGWSCAWIINLFAVLGDSENAMKYLNDLLAHATNDNLWGDHPPFQIDANFGGIAAIANMLVQDRNGEVRLLPALPKQFKDGYVKGLRIKNGRTVDIHWKNHELIEHRIY